jgi:2-oxoisovalerate dehydrogenase E1 component
VSEQQNSWLLAADHELARIKAAFSLQDKEHLFKGMLLTRATDNALKQLFLSGEITYQGLGFQGKGFRSLGQEAIYGATFKLKTGLSYIDNGAYIGDIAAPLIRDLGVFLAMSNDVETAINAQAGKAGKPCEGRDLHLGDFSQGLLMPAAPLAIATCTLNGIALAFKQLKQPRVAVSFIGEGGSSLGEWHEAINFAAVLQLPMIFCIENNQTALSTPTSIQTRAKTFADKGIGYGINSLIIDGNDIEAIAASFSYAADHARHGQGPVLIELVTMRMCGHAHHDDMLYLGKDPILGFEIPPLNKGGYANPKLYELGRLKDPIKIYQEQLIKDGVLTETKAHEFKQEAVEQVRVAINKVKARPWPKFGISDHDLVFKSPWIFIKKPKTATSPYTSDGITYLQALALGIKEVFIAHKNSLVIGEDVAPPYGNAFMMFKTIMDEFHGRFINTPISENAIVGACVGMAMNGLLPIGEIQFNDFVACAMNQVVNNAAKSYFRSGINVPMVLRMPYGGLRRAGPFHSQDTSPWFYRTPGLKIMAPSTPLDAMLMIQKAVLDPDPVLFYEHIALYRDPKIKQPLSRVTSHDIEGAQLIHEGDDLTIISYGSYAHMAHRTAERLIYQYNKRADVIDLRYLMPIDFATLYASIKKTARALLIGEDARTGSILESIASVIGQELFSELDAPVVVLGSRNIPVPYAPSLEDDYLLSEDHIVQEAVKLLSY